VTARSAFRFCLHAPGADPANIQANRKPRNFLHWLDATSLTHFCAIMRHFCAIMRRRAGWELVLRRANPSTMAPLPTQADRRTRSAYVRVAPGLRVTRAEQPRATKRDFSV
jgi:hypothetical protein